VVANLLAVRPGLRASRLRPSEVLRAEQLLDLKFS
jgi:hypothetical protein